MDIQVVIYTKLPFRVHRFLIPCTDIDTFEKSLKEDRFCIDRNNEVHPVKDHLAAYQRYLDSKKPNGSFAFYLYGERDWDDEKCYIFCHAPEIKTK